MIDTNDTILITGCGSGIGQAMARAFHSQGLKVCATARRAETLQPLAQEGMLTRTLDVTDDAAVAALLSELACKGHQVGALVNNAGYGAMGPMLDVPTAEWQRQFDVNLFAPMALTRAVLPGMT
jgi:NADP-dependent 3-hydroxy acid dehydrogenase YdfG